ncbi:hypothetical protein MATL_G00218190 [Megalops atlanticus]|uniref:Uncharacterized protein n=1 Tax=Megalops atlanticus TaxID=7932 RepID=A0A9D3SY41_MEGAT|nr:hypothetical protein MATL_G00218190 [Megalops atlanticus]
MRPCYKEAADISGNGAMIILQKRLQQGIGSFKDTMFQKAKEEMLELFKNLKEKIEENLRSKLDQSMQQVLLTKRSTSLPDVTEEYNKMKEYRERHCKNAKANACDRV